MIHWLFSYVCFCAINYMGCKYFNVKKSDNITSAIHATISTVLNLWYLYFGGKSIHELANVVSTGYYLVDMTFILLKQRGLSVMSIGYMYHHLATIYFIHYYPKINMAVKVMFLAELSNIPTYFVYHYLHSKNSIIEVLLWQFIQK